MLAKIEQLLQEIEGLQAANAEELEALRIKYLSKKGAINELMADFRNVPAEQKKEVGMKLNELKNKAQERIASLKEAFETQDNSAAEMDLTRTAYPRSQSGRCEKEHRTSHSHLFRTGKSYGTFATSYPHHLSGTCIPQ